VCSPPVVVMQTPEDLVRGVRSHVLVVLRLRWLAPDVLVDALVGPGVIEVFLVLHHCGMKVPLAQDQEVVQSVHDVSKGELSPQCARVSVSYSRPRACSPHPYQLYSESEKDRE
jgi:hypothetical protein